ncbi:Lrp/AsnC family transcriptional regulator, partial [Chloroflexota bacterium]
IEDRVISIAAVISPFKIGLYTPAHILIQADNTQINNILEQLSAMHQVHIVVLTAGYYDILIWAVFHSTVELSDFITQELSSVPGIIRTETIINLDFKKLELSILPTHYKIVGT